MVDYRRARATLLSFFSSGGAVTAAGGDKNLSSCKIRTNIHPPLRLSRSPHLFLLFLP